MDSACISTLCSSSFHSVFVTRTRFYILFFCPLSSMSFWLQTDVPSCVGTLKITSSRRVRALDQKAAREPCGNPKSCNFTSSSYTHANPRKGLRGNPAGTPEVATLPRVTPKIATLFRVRAHDHANPCKGLRVTPASCNFTSRRALDHANPRKGCASRLKAATLPRVRTLDHANPRKGCASRLKIATLLRRPCAHANPCKSLRVTPASCNFTSRSCARPCQSTQRLRVTPKSCNFTPRSCARPRGSLQRVAFPIDGIGAGSGFRKEDRYTDM